MCLLPLELNIVLEATVAQDAAVAAAIAGTNSVNSARTHHSLQHPTHGCTYVCTYINRTALALRPGAHQPGHRRWRRANQEQAATFVLFPANVCCSRSILACASSPFPLLNPCRFFFFFFFFLQANGDTVELMEMVPTGMSSDGDLRTRMRLR